MPHPVVGEGGRHHCNDGIDNDADGVTDCDDPGCATLSFCRSGSTGAVDPCPATVTIAGDPCVFPFTYSGISYNTCTTDDSADGVTPWCATRSDADGGWSRGHYDSCDCGGGVSHPPPPPPPPPPPAGGGGADDPNTETRRECRDGLDNDGDGVVDCADPDCATTPACAPTPECNDRTTRELLETGSCNNIVEGDVGSFCSSSCYGALLTYSTACAARPSATGRAMLQAFSGLMSQCVPWSSGEGLSFSQDCDAESPSSGNCPIAQASYAPTAKQIGSRCRTMTNNAMAGIQAACCDDAASCTSGAPTICSPACAITFLPFYSQCAATVWGNQPTFAATMQSFHDTCMNV
jgi:hypothetical protein